MSLRIAMIGQRGVPATWGGIERHVEELGARLAARGHEVVVYCRTNYGEARPDAYRGIRLRHLPTVGTKHFDAIVHSGLSTLAAMPQRFDIVHYHALGPGVLSVIPRYIGGARVVQTIHGLDNERAKWGRVSQSFLRTAGWMSARVPDATITVSRALADYYRVQHERPAVYVPNGVTPADPLPPSEITDRFGLCGRDYVLFVGRFVPEKAPDLLVRAFREIEGDVRLVLAGGSSFTDEYVDTVRRLAADDPRVVLAGYVYGDTLAELYTNAAAFVLPSTLEGLPLTLLEAASYGTPLIASDIPPHLEVLGGDQPGGRLFPSGDVDALTGALRRALGAGDIERAGARQVRDRVLAEYSWDAAVEQTETVYRSVLRQETLRVVANT